MNRQFVYLVWEEEQYEADVLCGVYDNLAAAKQHLTRLRRCKEWRKRRLSGRIDQARLATSFSGRGVRRWSHKQVLSSYQLPAEERP